MSTLHSLLFMSHIVLGSMALLLFWIPVASKKGSLDHVKYGRYYGKVMYAVALSGAAMALMVMFDPIGIKGELLRKGMDPEVFSRTVRVFWAFLLFLSLLTYVSVRHGFAVLKYKQDRSALVRFKYLFPLSLLFIGGTIMLLLGIQAGRTLHIIFGALGMLISTGMLRYCLTKTLSPGQWVIEHLSAMIGSGIGAHTAFLVFGGRQLFDDLGQLQILFWIAPGVVGSIAITMLSRKYTRQFNKTSATTSEQQYQDH